MTYSVKEIFPTLQGEGAQSGRAAVFLRFSGCNLWSGLERDRSTAICRFCDTDFVGADGPGGGNFPTAESLAVRIENCWVSQAGKEGPRFVVFTGGEPALQVDDGLIANLHALEFEIAIETNGTLSIPDAVDWVCVSPKAGAQLKIETGNELKVVFPQRGMNMEALSALDFQHYYVQPMDGPRIEQNTKAAIAYCRKHPQWRLSVQSHKYLGIP